MTSRDGRDAAGSGAADQEPPRPARARIRPFLNRPRSGPRPAADPEPGRAPAPGPGRDSDPGRAPDPGRDPGPAEGERPRPFVLTSGRVNGVDPDISLETQVTAKPVPPGPVAGLAPELQAIITTCAEPVSVAEISARVPLHLGVTKILVGDLRASGYLDVHTTDVVNPHDPETILRVIRGLRAIA